MGEPPGVEEGSPESSAYAEGDVIGKYVLTRRLGQGGMGEVWVAHNRALDSDVAVKFISPVAEGEDARRTLSERLLREARATAKLDHPSIVKVFDFGQTKVGDPMIVMELLEGQDLGELLQQKEQLSPTRAVRILLPIAHALALAHEKEIVHRDLKPENIFLAKSKDGRVQPKILDFGIAKAPDKKSHRLTQEGSLLGSPEYMSPEQAYGDDASFPTDIWAFTVVLYEAVTGERPFVGKNYNTLLRAVTHNEPRPVSGFEGADELWNIMKRGLEKNAAERWESMREMGLRLALWLQQQGARDDVTGQSLDVAWLEPAGLAQGFSSLVPPPPSGPTSVVSPVSAPVESQVGAQDLDVIAQIHEGGDPVEVMQRESRRRLWILGAIFVLLIIGGTASILIGTGIVER